MNVGDLVTVLPAKEGIYILVEQLPACEDEYLGKCWMLYNEALGLQRMHEKWIRLINDYV
jgi:hypothetical protein